MLSIWTTCFVETARPRAVSGGGRRSSSRLRALAYAGGALCNATARNASPSQSQSVPNLASQSRVAFASIAWNTGSSSPGELEMARNTSEVAVCCSRISDSSRVRACSSSDSCRFCWRASSSSWVSCATFCSASVPRGLCELRGADRRGRDADTDAPSLRCVTMTARFVSDRKPESDDQLHQPDRHEEEQLSYLDCGRIMEGRGDPIGTSLRGQFRARRRSPNTPF